MIVGVQNAESSADLEWVVSTQWLANCCAGQLISGNLTHVGIRVLW